MSDDFVMRITPRGIFYPPRSLEERVQAARLELSKVLLLMRSEVRARGFEKVLGLLFLAVEPIMMAFVYYVLTYIILSSQTTGTQFISIYIAVVTWRWMSKTVDSSPTAFSSNSTVLKQTNFSAVSILFIFMSVEFVYFLIAFTTLVVFCVFLGYLPGWRYIFLVFPMLAEASIIMFLTVIFACAGVFVRDLQGFLYSIIAIWFYMSPGIYPIENVPQKFLWVYYMNPFAHILPAYQGIMMRKEIPNIGTLLIITAVMIPLIVAAFALLHRVRRHFFSFI